MSDSIFTLLPSLRCQNCLDTNIEIGLFGIGKCAQCVGKGYRWSPASLQLSETVAARQRSTEIDQQLLSVARVLTHYAATAPLTLTEICANWRVNERTAKGIIADLRTDWLLPVGSSRQKPYGAYWISTAAEFLDWSRSYRAQAITSLVTLNRLQRKHYPRLFGQADFDFADDIARSIKEAL